MPKRPGWHSKDPTLPVEARRHLAEISLVPPRGLVVPGGPPLRRFAIGFRSWPSPPTSASSAAKRPPDPMPVRAGCCAEFEPTASDDYCEACLREGGAL